jgi:S1-C subfamily serine protease
MVSSSRVAIAGVLFVLTAGVAGAQERLAPVLMCSMAEADGMFSGLGTGLMSGGGGHDKSGYLGIAFHDVSEGDVGLMRLKDGHGAVIIMVDHDGPAGKAGLRERDVVLSVNGTTVDGEDQLRKILHDTPPGKSISLYICRSGAEQTVTAVMSTREEVEKQARQRAWSVPAPADDSAIASTTQDSPVTVPRRGFSFLPDHLLPTSTYTGAKVDTMGAQLADYFGVKDGKGLLVHEVETNSPAATAGLRAGDVVTKMNGNRVSTEKDWTRALHDSKGRSVSLTVIRDRHEQTLTMVPDSKRRSSVDQSVSPPTIAMPVMMLR